MTFNEFFESHKGYWDGRYAMVDIGGYVRCVAIGTPDGYELTDFGRQNIIESEVKPVKRTRRVQRVQVEQPKTDIDDLDLDSV